MTTRWTRADLGTEQKLESLLRKLQKDLTDMEQRNLDRLAALQADFAAQVRGVQSASSARLSALQGAISKALQVVPSDISVYDEQNNQWIDNPNASATQAGIVTTGDQTFAGNKTFDDDIIVNGLQYFDTQWRFTWSDSHLNVEYYDGAAWGIKGTFIP